MSIWQRINNVIDEHSLHIIDTGRSLMSLPEPGYKEKKTASFIIRLLQELSINIDHSIALTGMIATIDGRSGSRGPVLAVMGELDALACPDHPHASRFGFAHACGHHITTTAIYGALLGITHSGVIGELDGRLKLIFSPAEEYEQLNDRLKLIESGRITYVTGKTELIASGAFDNVNAAIMIHPGDVGSSRAGIVGPCPGACALIITGTDSNRHTQMQSLTRVADRLTALAASGRLNSIGVSFHVTYERTMGRRDRPHIVAYVRSPTLVGLIEGRKAIMRTLASLAGELTITPVSGVLPRKRAPVLDKLCWQSMREVVDGGVDGPKSSDGCTDVGDVSYLLPTTIMTIGGCTGSFHRPSFTVKDERTAYVTSSRILARTIMCLLADGSKHIHRVAATYRPPLSSRHELDRLWTAVLSTGIART